MSDETSKSIVRRLCDIAFAEHYFIGHGIDIGAGDDCLEKHAALFPRMRSCRRWDIEDGDAARMAGLPDNSFDFVHSSHCLEHLADPHIAVRNWVRICKPGGYVVVLVPDEDMYEQRIWPSTFNPDHKATFTIWKGGRSWSPASINLTDLCRISTAEIIKIESLHTSFDWTLPRTDQTRGAAESAIEFILRKRRAT